MKLKLLKQVLGLTQARADLASNSFLLTGKIDNEESYLRILAAKRSHTAHVVSSGILLDGRHLALGKCSRG